MVKMKKLIYDPVLIYIRRMSTRDLKQAAVKMEVIIRDGWTRRHLVRAIYDRVKSDNSPNRLMMYYLYK